MKKSELKTLLRMALQNYEAERALANANHDRVVAIQSDIDSVIEKRDNLQRDHDKLALAVKSIGEQFDVASDKLKQLGCAFDTTTGTWTDPVPKPKSFTSAVFNPVPPPASWGWVDGTKPYASPVNTATVEWVDMGGLTHADQWGEIIAKGNIAWWRFPVRAPAPVPTITQGTDAVLAPAPVPTITQDTNAMETCRGVRKPITRGWSRGDREERPPSYAFLELIRTPGSTNRRKRLEAGEVDWDTVAWWREVPRRPE